MATIGVKDLLCSVIYFQTSLNVAVVTNDCFKKLPSNILI